jgi:1-aminocyclopropane-1-carboxylate deaminase/D-cysteine desulfhydrase-like pyridoxal-dependent ACC family enzyme
VDFKIPVSPLHPITWHPGLDAGVSLYLKRDDLLHPEVHGNKWRKLAPLLAQVRETHPKGIITFGGPFSNHLHAVAAAGRLFNFPTFGIVRGLSTDTDNPTLRAAQQNGMRLLPVSREMYRDLKVHAAALLGTEASQYFVLPEGGATRLAVENCASITREIFSQLPGPRLPDTPVFICVPAGTGCTAAGIISSFEVKNGQVLIFPVVNRGFEAPAILQQMLEAGVPAQPDELEKRFGIIRDYELGGFAKLHLPAYEFALEFERQTGILLDPVYTSKMMFGIYDMLANGKFPPGSTVVALHTGGLQGWDGFNARYGDLLQRAISHVVRMEQALGDI